MKDHKYVPIKLGWIYSSEMRAHKINDKPGPSYSKIDLINEITDQDLKHIIEIRDHAVYLNGSFVVSAPSNKTKAFKLKFCKSVIWGLIDNRDDLRDLLKKITISEEAPIYTVPAPLRFGPCSLYGYHKIGSCMVMEEAISCN